MPAEPKAPYKLVVKLDGAKPEHVAEALLELREKASEYDQSGDTSATMTIEAFQESPLRAIMDAFETWLFYHGHAECEMKLTRPGLRPETRDMLTREKHRTPMDKALKDFQDYADKNNVSLHGSVLGQRIDVEPVSSDKPPGVQALEWLERRER